jgi:tRNA(His) 5'-end guanylyltransferase
MYKRRERSVHRVQMSFLDVLTYCFLLPKPTSKILSLLVSLFTSSYVYHWTDYFPSTNDKLQYPPTFDGRIVQYPTEKEVRDYFSWRQADSKLDAVGSGWPEPLPR